MIPPILLIVYNRPALTQQTFSRLAELKPKQLFIAADGPKANNEADELKCREVRDIVGRVDWECEVKTLFREENLGCKYGVSNAISWFFTYVEEGIILEDDCLPTMTFFKFCSVCLNKYRSAEQIMMISGTSYQTSNEDHYSYYFSKYIHIWGWATWKRAWQKYDVELADFDKNNTLKFLEKTFSTKREQVKWLNDFKSIVYNQFDTWDTQWMYKIWQNNALTIVPWKNMISNIGYGPDATHTTMENSPEANMISYNLEHIIHPNKLRLNKKADNFIRYNFIITSNYHRIKSKLLRSFKMLLKL